MRNMERSQDGPIKADSLEGVKEKIKENIRNLAERLEYESNIKDDFGNPMFRVDVGESENENDLALLLVYVSESHEDEVIYEPIGSVTFVLSESGKIKYKLEGDIGDKFMFYDAEVKRQHFIKVIEDTVDSELSHIKLID